jgi:hypothetical protein
LLPPPPFGIARRGAVSGGDVFTALAMFFLVSFMSTLCVFSSSFHNFKGFLTISRGSYQYQGFLINFKVFFRVQFHGGFIASSSFYFPLLGFSSPVLSNTPVATE